MGRLTFHSHHICSPPLSSLTLCSASFSSPCPGQTHTCTDMQRSEVNLRCHPQSLFTFALEPLFRYWSWSAPVQLDLQINKLRMLLSLYLNPRIWGHRWTQPLPALSGGFSEAELRLSRLCSNNLTDWDDFSPVPSPTGKWSAWMGARQPFHRPWKQLCGVISRG